MTPGTVKGNMSKTRPRKFSVDYFIAKFKAIPKELWCTGKYRDGEKRCALGHCGMRDADMVTQGLEILTLEAAKLYDLFADTLNLLVGYVNDKKSKSFPQKHPKDRILACLKKIKGLRSKVWLE